MKICVYAIAKNEEKFVDRWIHSMREADCICVLDTGSTDATVELLADRGVIVKQDIVEPWRFDVARNRSMDLIPKDADICVCTDLDEIFRPGWRKLLEEAWTEGTEQLRYTYIWNFNERGMPGTTFLYEKIHAPGVFRWEHPVHEVLRRTDGKTGWKQAEAPGIVLEHHPDHAKSRAGYLELLELSVREAPGDDRNAHYLGREYMFWGRWDDAIRQLKAHLAMPSAVWEPERCASMRFLSRCCLAKGDGREAMRWALRAIAEAPETREPWVQAQEVAYAMEAWEDVAYYGGKALLIEEKSGTYINEEKAWGAYPWDAMAYAMYKMGEPSRAAEATIHALEIDPDNQRLKNNLAFYWEET
ncbi:tetratricopeptide repeat-containing glycosyltransferase [uncultured Flavonifractor sp.]|uniref:tetratricopeptide repeat-containing glycosyltransferase n=1 Tax=uncultured Flavonifractor sp. TaxID=1193534 RepID=UPI002614CCFD|nr:glycosyltransferase [uncultured Flavonifractor sp.]